MIGACLLSIALTAPQQLEKPIVLKKKGTLSGSNYALEFVEDNFVAGTRKLFWVKSGDSEEPATGTPAKPIRFYGHDLGKSQLEGKSLQQYFESNFTQILSMKVPWKGRTTTFGKSMFSDLLNPFFSQDNVSVKVAKAGGLSIQLDGSDGAGAYTAVWTVDVKGGIKRTVEPGD